MSDLSNRQSAASRQGRRFEEIVEGLLLIDGWTINARNWRHPEIEVEVDIVATNPEGVEWWIECKGSWESPSRNGLERTDTLKKAIGSAALIRLLPDRRPYMVITSHLPVSGAALKWYELALNTYVDKFRVVGLS